MKIHWSPRASNDYLAVLQYLQKEWGVKVVQSFVKRVNDILSLILANPNLFNPSQKKKEIRRCVITKHISLYYRQNNQKIELIAFIDNRSNPKEVKF
ncbi:MAG: type II toxin-antitoxin system RelE/ParE family toxin [Cyclobacteriaceae bacterium]